jgi:hypothetical protein
MWGSAIEISAPTEKRSSANIAHRVQALPLHLLKRIVETFNALAWSFSSGRAGACGKLVVAGQDPRK